jgi:2-iminobutanoate/2-iminopropanoate deaminase
MMMRMPANCGDDTCPSCVVAGDYIFLAHHAGGFDKSEAAHQMRAAFESLRTTLNSVGAVLNDMVQINLYLKNLNDFNEARNVFYEYFDKDCFPSRMTTTTEFLNPECLCMIDGTAYKPKILN